MSLQINPHLSVILIMILASIISAVATLLIKKSSKTFSLESFNIFKSFDIFKNYYLIIGGILLVVVVVLTIIALRIGNISLVYPLASLAYVFATFLSWYYLEEKINALRITGIVCIILGIILVTL